MTFEEMERAMDRQQQYGREIDQRIAALLKVSEGHESRLAEQDERVRSGFADVDERIAALLKTAENHENWLALQAENHHSRVADVDDRIAALLKSVEDHESCAGSGKSASMHASRKETSVSTADGRSSMHASRSETSVYTADSRISISASMRWFGTLKSNGLSCN